MRQTDRPRETSSGAGRQTRRRRSTEDILVNERSHSLQPQEHVMATIVQETAKRYVYKMMESPVGRLTLGRRRFGRDTHAARRRRPR